MRPRSSKRHRRVRAGARLRILDDRPYPAIADEIGRPIPIVRAYVNKARRRIRQHPLLRRLASERGLGIRRPRRP